MPDIVDYSAASNADIKLEPSNTGVNAADQAGYRIGRSANELGEHFSAVTKEVGDQYQQAVFQQEVSAGYAQKTTIQATALQALDKAATADALGQDAAGNPVQHDPDMYSKFLTAMQPQLDAWTQTFKTPQGKAWAVEQAKDIYGSLAAKSINAQQTLALGAFNKDRDEQLAGLNQSASSDPAHTLDYVRQWDADLKGMAAAHQISAEGVAQMETNENGEQRNIALSGFQKLLDNGDFETAQKLIDDPMFHTVFGDTATLTKEITQQRRAALEAQNQLQASQDKQLEDNAKITFSQAQQSVWPGPDGAPPSPDASARFILTMQKLARENPRGYALLGDAPDTAIRSLQAQAKDRINGTFTSDAPGYTAGELYARLGNSANPLTQEQLDAARAHGQISQKTYEDTSSAIRDAASNPAKDQAWKSGVSWFGEAVRKQLTSSPMPTMDPSDPNYSAEALVDAQGNKADPKGELVAAEAMREFREAFDMRVASGQYGTPQQVMDTLTNPNNNQNFLSIRMRYLQAAKSSADPSLFFTQHQYPLTRPGGSAPAGPPAAVTSGSVPAVQAAQVQAAPSIPRKPGETPAQYLARVQGG